MISGLGLARDHTKLLCSLHQAFLGVGVKALNLQALILVAAVFCWETYRSSTSIAS